MPGLVEADDDGLYVLKFRGAGQGPKALVAEIVAGELARAAGLPVPEIVFMELDPQLGAAEPDPEIQELIAASGGRNVALDFLPGLAHLQPGRGPDARPGPRRRDRLARRAGDERRPLAAEPEPAAVARPALADRPRRRALPASTPGRTRPPTRTARSRRSATTCCCPCAGDILAADARLAPRLDGGVVERVLGRCPTSGSRRGRAPSTPSTCAAGSRRRAGSPPRPRRRAAAA